MVDEVNLNQTIKIIINKLRELYEEESPSRFLIRFTQDIGKLETLGRKGLVNSEFVKKVTNSLTEIEKDSNDTKKIKELHDYLSEKI